MSYKSKTLEELLDLLSVLDSKLDYFRDLDELSLPMKLDIVGGGALCYWNLRLNNMTYDLDSFTEIDDKVKKFINEVEPGNWLNDDVRNISGRNIYLNDLKFKESNYNFRNIDLRFASLKSLLKTKLFSLYNNARAGFSLRTTTFKKDLKDIYGLLDYLDIESKNSLDKNYYSFAFERIFPDTQEYINPDEFKYWNGPKTDLIDKFKLFSERIK